MYTAVFTWRDLGARFISVRRSNDGEAGGIALRAEPADPEDFDATVEAVDRAQRSRLIRMTRTTLGLSQEQFATRFHVPVGTLRDWELAWVTAPDFALRRDSLAPASPRTRVTWRADRGLLREEEARVGSGCDQWV